MTTNSPIKGLTTYKNKITGDLYTGNAREGIEFQYIDGVKFIKLIDNKHHRLVTIKADAIEKI